LTVLKKSKAIPEDFEFFSLHGKVPQQKRPLVFNKVRPRLHFSPALHIHERTLVTQQHITQFVAEKNGCALLATDLAARGLDVPDVDWIIQYVPGSRRRAADSMMRPNSDVVCL
jgi:superfamily II DNA/RNA helicase